VAPDGTLLVVWETLAPTGDRYQVVGSVLPPAQQDSGQEVVVAVPAALTLEPGPSVTWAGPDHFLVGYTDVTAGKPVVVWVGRGCAEGPWYCDGGQPRVCVGDGYADLPTTACSGIECGQEACP
jgi:hypothetical protein